MEPKEKNFLQKKIPLAEASGQPVKKYVF